MRKILYVLGQLEDQDVEWMARVGTRRRVPAGTVLIEEGIPVPAMYVLIDGRLEVSVKSLGSIAALGAGEVVGEMSFVDRSPPSATVAAAEDCTVLEIQKRLIQDKLADDHAFGHRFYRALATFLADRLRGTVERLGYGEAGGDLGSDEMLRDELDEAVLDTVSLAGERFHRLLQTLSGSRPG